MKIIYPIIITAAPEGGSFSGEFPDLEDCRVQAPTLEGLMELAHDALEGWITAEMEEDAPQLPPVSHPEDLKPLLAPGQTLRQVCITYRMYEGWDE